MRYVFDYALGDWLLRRPSGMEERKERDIADEKDAKRAGSGLAV